MPTFEHCDFYLFILIETKNGVGWIGIWFGDYRTLRVIDFERKMDIPAVVTKEVTPGLRRPENHLHF